MLPQHPFIHPNTFSARLGHDAQSKQSQSLALYQCQSDPYVEPSAQLHLGQ